MAMLLVGSRSIEVAATECDKDKMDDMVLALSWRAFDSHEFGAQAWRSHDRGGRRPTVHEKGYMSDPKSTAKSRC